MHLNHGHSKWLLVQVALSYLLLFAFSSFLFLFSLLFLPPVICLYDSILSPLLVYLLYFLFLPFYMLLIKALEKEMATHSSVLAWRIPGTGEPGGLPSMGSHRVRRDWSDVVVVVVVIKAYFQIALCHLTGSVRI